MVARQEIATDSAWAGEKGESVSVSVCATLLGCCRVRLRLTPRRAGRRAEGEEEEERRRGKGERGEAKAEADTSAQLSSQLSAPNAPRTAACFPHQRQPLHFPSAPLSPPLTCLPPSTIRHHTQASTSSSWPTSRWSALGCSTAGTRPLLGQPSPRSAMSCPVT